MTCSKVYGTNVVNMFANVSFHLTDRCNLRCHDCHWFSGPITEPEKVPTVDDWLGWIEQYRNTFQSLRLTGGEPTMYSGFVELVNRIPTEVKLTICTNGTNLPALSKINRTVQLLVSRNRAVDDTFEANVRAIGHQTSFVTYMEGGRFHNQLQEGRKFLSLVGANGFCTPSYIRFGSDGHAYQCEVGLRTKAESIRSGFSLWSGNPTISTSRCTATTGCLSNFMGENTFITENQLS